MKTSVNQPTEDDLEYYIGFNLKLLSSIGLKCSLEKNLKSLGLINKLPTFIMCIHGLIFFIFENYFIRDIWSSDKTLAMQILSQEVSNIQCISKGFFLAFAIERMQNVFQEMQYLWKTYRPSQDNRKKILLGAHQTFSFCKIYFFVLLSCSISYFLCLIPSLFNLAQQYRNREANNYTYDFSQRLGLVKYPFEIPNIPTYLLIVFQEAFYLFYTAALFWVSGDTLFAQSVTHICLQFKILKYDIDATFNREDMRDHLSLVTIVKRHRDLLRICKLIEEVFSPIILSIMLLSSLNLCVNVVGIRGTIAKENYQETAINVTIFMLTFLQILFYCTFAEKISEETRSLADTIYNCDWTVKNYKLRFYIQLIIMRCQKPFYCTAYGFFPIGHLQLTTVLNTAFSYYMMLQTMN
ncbi:odorant receptor 269 [Nasonia vitripennis]|uniref:Odorant receptor n=1 Tax=Nasonia vitripennis TaxID=7425 RepID=A0A7M6UE36_NASVI|nr:odorant receptor 269 [Nasonia vitripennis]